MSHKDYVIKCSSHHNAQNGTAHPAAGIHWVFVRQVMWTCCPLETSCCQIVLSNNSTPMILPPLSFILLLTPPQSRAPLPRVVEPSPPSPTSTEGPDGTDSDSSVYTASSSSSSFSFSSSSSFYATSSSSTSEKVSQLDTVKTSGRGLLVWKLLAFFILSPSVRLFVSTHAQN